VQQRPGKPFWFGKHENGVLVFAFPGNPVSTFMCLHRFFLPWLENSIGIAKQKQYAVLSEDYIFTPALQYFLQVKLSAGEDARLYGPSCNRKWFRRFFQPARYRRIYGTSAGTE
jgi:molybdopterin molybdotransferase